MGVHRRRRSNRLLLLTTTARERDAVEFRCGAGVGGLVAFPCGVSEHRSDCEGECEGPGERDCEWRVGVEAG